MKIAGVRTISYEVPQVRAIAIDEGALRQYQVTRSSRDAMGSTWGQSGWGRRRGAGLYLVGPDEPDELDD